VSARWIGLALGLVAACSSDPAATADSGAATVDTGTAAVTDAATVDTGAAAVTDAGAAPSCGTATEFSATVNGAPFCFPRSGATMPRTGPQQTIAIGSTADGVSRTLSLTFPGPGVGTFRCAGGTAGMVYREVSATGHTGQNSPDCVITVSEVGTGSPVIIRGTFSGVLPYTDGAAPHGSYAITQGRFAIERQVN
jgi:hypothetical protein